ncbi:MAG: hypothetical protein E6H53_08220 [Betaproteobacteria bacterium]|nr:MAG: hypothetical protein E6H53_08220 [Betaproteobacteria bacterium]
MSSGSGTKCRTQPPLQAHSWPTRTCGGRRRLSPLVERVRAPLVSSPSLPRCAISKAAQRRMCWSSFPAPEVPSLNNAGPTCWCASIAPSSKCRRFRGSVQRGGRVFIEVERFDRVGRHGRLAVCDLDAIQPTFLGVRSTEWPELSRRLQDMDLLDTASVTAVEHLWWFGRLIANTDMHLGNLSFHVDHTLRLAPTYDMLPMAYAPLAGGEVPIRDYTPALPLPSQQATWLAACAIAIDFWNGASLDTRISGPFRVICRANAARLRDVAEKL